MRFTEEGREWKLICLAYRSLTFYFEMEKDLKVVVGHFLEVCRRGLKVNSDKIKVMMLGVEKESLCDALEDEKRFEHALGFKYLECVLDEFGIDGAECCRKVMSGGKLYTIRSPGMLEICNLIEWARVYYMIPCLCLFYCMELRLAWREGKI